MTILQQASHRREGAKRVRRWSMGGNVHVNITLTLNSSRRAMAAEEESPPPRRPPPMPGRGGPPPMPPSTPPPEKPPPPIPGGGPPPMSTATVSENTEVPKSKPVRPPPPPAYVPKYDEPTETSVVDNSAMYKEGVKPPTTVPALPPPTADSGLPQASPTEKSTGKRRPVSSRVLERQTAMFGEKKSVEKTKIQIEGGGVAARLAALKKKAEEQHHQKQHAHVETGGGVKERLAHLKNSAGFDIEKLAARAGGGWQPSVAQKQPSDASTEGDDIRSDLVAKKLRLESQLEQKRRAGEDLTKDEAELEALIQAIADLEKPAPPVEESPAPEPDDMPSDRTPELAVQQRAVVKSGRRRKTVKKMTGTDTLVDALDVPISSPSGIPEANANPASLEESPVPAALEESSPSLAANQPYSVPAATQLSPLSTQNQPTSMPVAGNSPELPAATQPPPMPETNQSPPLFEQSPLPQRPGANQPPPMPSVVQPPPMPIASGAVQESDSSHVIEEDGEIESSSEPHAEGGEHQPSTGELQPSRYPTAVDHSHREDEAKGQQPAARSPAGHAPAKSGGFLRRFRKSAAATTRVRGVFSGGGGASKAKSKKNYSVDEAAAAVAKLGGQFTAIADKIREARIDGPFLRALSKAELEETLIDLGAVCPRTSSTCFTVALRLTASRAVGLCTSLG